MMLLSRTASGPGIESIELDGQRKVLVDVSERSGCAWVREYGRIRQKQHLLAARDADRRSGELSPRFGDRRDGDGSGASSGAGGDAGPYQRNPRKQQQDFSPTASWSSLLVVEERKRSGVRAVDIEVQPARGTCDLV
jgi:hypothetical protein